MIRDFRSTTWIPFFLAFSLALLAACGGANGNSQDGERWYKMYNCNACHGDNGNDGKAAKIAGLSMSFRSFLWVLRRPPSASMPAFPEEKVSKQDAADMYSWLKTLNKG